MATAAFAARSTPTTNVAPPTMATSAPTASSLGRVVAPAQLLRLSTSQQQACRQASQPPSSSMTRSPLQPLHLQLQQFQIQQRPADLCAHQIHHPTPTLLNGANSASLSANSRSQHSQARQLAATLAASERLAVWRRSPASSPPPSSSSSSSSTNSSTSVSITRASVNHQQQQQIRLYNIESLENKPPASGSELFVANGGASVAAAATAQCQPPVCVTGSHRHRSEADTLTAKVAATVAHHDQVSTNNLTARKKLVIERPPALNTLPTTRVASRQAHAKLSATATKLTSTPATTNSRLRQGALYARRQYQITAAAASAVGPSSAAVPPAVTSLGRLTSAKCTLGATTNSLSATQLAPTAKSCSRTLASVSGLGRVCPLSRGLSARSVASLTVASCTAGVAGRIVASISGGLPSQSSSSAASSTLQLIHSRSSNCKQKQQQQQYNCSRSVTSRFLRSSTPADTAAKANREETERAGQGTSCKFSLLSSSTSSLSLGSVKRARPTPRLAREKAAALEVETRIIDSRNQDHYNRNHYHSGKQQRERQGKMQLQSQQQNQKRPIALSRRSSNSSNGSDGCGGGDNVKRLTSLNNSSLRASSLAVSSIGVDGSTDLNVVQSSRRRQSTATSNRPTPISTAPAGALTSIGSEAAADYLAATAQQQQRSDVDLAGACNALSHADQRETTAAATAVAITARSGNFDSGASSNGDNDNNNNNNNNNDKDYDYDVHIPATKSHKDNLVSIENITTNTIHGNPTPFYDKSLIFADQERQYNFQPTCESIIAAAAAATAAAAAVAAVAAKDKMIIQSEQLVSTGKDKLIPSPIINNNNINNNINHNNNISIAAGRGCPPDIPIRTEPISDYYDLEARPFARGKFAQVKRCVNKSTKQCFAAKCIKKRRRLVDIRHEILLEIEALKLSYRTDRIVKLFEVFETQTEITLILEMANGGELQRVLDEEEVIDETLVKRMIRQILDGLVELHDIDIAHLDIKPQNLLLTQSFPNGDVKLCDFGISRRITKDCEIREICGTPDYAAPEILSYDPISLATDMWSLGVLTYALLSGYSPFGSEDKQQTFCNITQATLDFPSEIFEKISDEAIDFMRKLILRDPSERMTSRQAKKHPWLYSGP